MAEPISVPGTQPKEDDYFDPLFSVFEAHKHPVILLNQAAGRWMGPLSMANRSKPSESYRNEI